MLTRIYCFVTYLQLEESETKMGTKTESRGKNQHKVESFIFIVSLLRKNPWLTKVNMR